MERIRKWIGLPVAVLFTLALAGCSAPSQAGVATLGEQDRGDEAAASEDAEEHLVEWAECMREQGIDVPDPSTDGEGNLVFARRAERPAAGSGELPERGAIRLGDDFRKAVEECGEPPMAPGAGPNEQEIADLQESALKLAQCMREQGIADFPDPDFSDFGPGAGPRQGARVEGPFAGVDMNDPKVQEAFEACRDKLPERPFIMRAPSED